MKSKIYEFYEKTKKQHPEEIVLIRIGDFYEAFGNDAVIAANVLDLTLTGRNCGIEERVPMVGFPFHIADEYIKKLNGAGKVAFLVEL